MEPTCTDKLFFGIQSFFKSFWTIGMLTLQQGLPGSYTLHNRGMAQKVLFIVWLVTSFLIAAIYGSKLIGILLAFKDEVVPFTNLAQLADAMNKRDYRLVILTEELGSWEERLRATRPREELAAWTAAARRYPPTVVPDLDTLTRMLRADPFLVYPCRWTETEFQLDSALRCQLRFVASPEEAVPVAVPLPPNFTHREAFNRALLRLSKGVMQLNREKYIATPLCDKLNPYEEMGLSVYELQAAFWLFAIGSLATLVALAAEWGWSLTMHSYAAHRDSIDRSVSRLADRLGGAAVVRPKTTEQRAVTGGMYKEHIEKDIPTLD